MHPDSFLTHHCPAEYKTHTPPSVQHGQANQQQEEEDEDEKLGEAQTLEQGHSGRSGCFVTAIPAIPPIAPITLSETTLLPVPYGTTQHYRVP